MMMLLWVRAMQSFVIALHSSQIGILIGWIQFSKDVIGYGRSLILDFSIDVVGFVSAQPFEFVIILHSNWIGQQIILISVHFELEFINESRSFIRILLWR